MTQQANRGEWLERQLAEVAGFIERDTQRLAASPDNRSLQISLRSWQNHHEELSAELQALASSSPQASN